MAETFSVPGNNSGTYTSPVDKALIHTTEGGSIEGAVAAYRANNSWPHRTVDCRFGKEYRVATHLPLNVPARSLRNESGGVQTNRDGVLQYEVVGSATRPHEIDWAWFGANVLGPDCRAMGVPIQSSVAWVAYPQSYGKRAAQRLSAAQWGNYRGVLGHQHCPENDHGDPGSIPIQTVLAAAGGAPVLPPEEIDPMATISDWSSAEQEAMIRLVRIGNARSLTDENGSELAALRAELAKVKFDLAELKKLAQFVTTGAHNSTFNPAVPGNEWMNDAPSIADLVDAPAPVDTK